MRKKIVYLALFVALVFGGCINDQSKKDEFTGDEVTVVDLTPTAEEKNELEAIMNEIASEYPIPVEDVEDVKRAGGTNPSVDEIISVMKTIGKKYNIPYEVLYGIGMIESNLKQYKSNGQPLISGDEGYGIMQVTPWAISEKFNVESLKWSYKYNIEAGAQVILGKWKYAKGRNPIGDSNPMVLENWYITIWAYNGYSTINNPNEYRNGPRKWSNGYISWTRNAPYQVDVLNAIKNKFGINITKIPNSQLPLTGIPASGKKFATPTPIHYSGNGGDIVAGTPDVIVDSVWSVPSTPKPGEKVKLYAKIKNIGNGSTNGNVGAAFYIDGVQKDLWWHTEGAMAAGTEKVYCMDTDYTALKSFKVEVFVDDLNLIKESNETNNKKAVDISVNDKYVEVIIPSPITKGVKAPFNGSVSSSITKISAIVDSYVIAKDIPVTNGKYSFGYTFSNSGTGRTLIINGFDKNGAIVASITKKIDVK